MISNLIFPGWAVPPHLYKPYTGYCGKDIIIDYGFFRVGTTFDFDKFSLPDDGDYIITAHSMGSLLALEAAASLDEIKALVLFSPFARFCVAPDCPGQQDENVGKMIEQLETSPERLLKSFYRTFAKPSSFKIDVPGFLNAYALRNGLEFLLRRDCRECLKNVKAPVLIMLGGRDEISPLAMGEYLAKHLPGAGLCVLEDAGHALPFTHTEKCKMEIKSFLKNRKLIE